MSNDGLKEFNSIYKDFYMKYLKKWFYKMIGTFICKYTVTFKNIEFMLSKLFSLWTVF